MSTSYTLDRRTTTEIQGKIVKWGKRNAISQFLHTKNDEKMIATWRLELTRILQVFNVCPVHSVRSLLTFHFQAQPVMNPPATISDVRHDVANAHAIVSDVHHDSSQADNKTPDVRRDGSNTLAVISGVRHDVAGASHIVSEVRSDVVNTQNTVSGIHRNALKTREGKDGQNPTVRITRALPFTEWQLIAA